MFLALIDKSFPHGHPLKKICNRNTIKLSYKCTPNMSSVISARNAKLLAAPPAPEGKTCSCPKTKSCPLGGKCLSESMVYRTTIAQENTKVNTYTGLTCNTFKKRLYAHEQSFKNPEKKQTSLSKHIRNLKAKKVKHTIKWEQVDRAKTYSPVSGICALCTKEKFYITFKPGINPLNSKSEMFANCRHKKRLLLCGGEKT